MRSSLLWPAEKHYIVDTENGKYITEENPSIDRKSYLYYVYSKQWRENNYELRELYLIDNGEFYYRNDSLKILTFDEVKELIQQGKMTVELPEGVSLRIFDMGVYKISKNEELQGKFNHEHMTFEKDSEFLKELEDRINQCRGKPSASSICIKAWEDWNKDKTEENRLKLKEAYETVPERKQRYLLGSMDVKDIPIRMAIYGDQEKEKWSHRIVGKILKEKGIIPDLEIPDIKLKGEW